MPGQEEEEMDVADQLVFVLSHQMVTARNMLNPVMQKSVLNIVPHTWLSFVNSSPLDGKQASYEQ